MNFFLRRVPRVLFKILLTGWALGAACAFAAGPAPILLELFTSEGCSSCPPVDAWVKRLDAEQAVPGAHLIVLSEHVDYWDHDGWRDPYSSAQLTERQREYQQALGRSDVYTPQVILDGNVEVQPWKTQEVAETLEKLAMAPTVPVRLELSGSEPGYVTGRVEVDRSAQRAAGDVVVALALDHAQSQVTAGENGGKRLEHVAVVKELVRVGKTERGQDFAQGFRLKLWPGAEAGNLRVVAFVQEAGPGRVLGAAMVKGMQAPGTKEERTSIASGAGEPAGRRAGF